MSHEIKAFGKYILLEQVASGGMAEVYLAKQANHSGVTKFVAIKRILPQFADHEDYVQWFIEEAKVTVNLRHTNVVSIYEFGAENKELYLVMEYVEGKNLRQFLTDMKKNSKSFSTEQILHIIREAASGLDYAHRCINSSTGELLNIVHRDMSPQNLMISFEGEVKIIDFGIAKSETQAESTQVGTLKGKYAYMSPEQAEGQVLNGQSDIFSLGIILWELLANERLFTANNEIAVVKKVRECNIPPIRKINPLVTTDLERIVMKALAKEKSLRYESAEAFHRDLSRYMNMHYPDFSMRDFASYLKDTFSSHFSEIKQKQVDFSKVVMPTSGAAKPTEATPFSPAGKPAAYEGSLPQVPNFGNPEDPFEDSQISQFQSPEGKIDLSSDSSESELEPPAHLTQTAASNPKTNLSFSDLTSSRQGNSVIKKQVTETKNKFTPAAADRTASRNSFSPGEFKTPGKNPFQATRTPFKKKTFLSEHGQTLGYVAIVGVIAFATMSYLGNQSTKSPNGKIALALQSLGIIKKPAKPIEEPLKSVPDLPERVVATQTPGQSDFASNKPTGAISEISVSVKSSPSGARILLDGKDTGLTTPTLLKVEAGKIANFRLVKEGFNIYEAQWAPTETGQTLTAGLVKLQKTGTLAITLLNTGGNAILTVDGNPVELTQGSKTSIIVAGDVVHEIEAQNSVTGQKASGKVLVPENQRSSIELILK